MADPRTQDPKVYADECIPNGATIYGVGAQVDPTSGKVTNKGTIKDSVVVELKSGSTHTINSLVFSILATEAVRT